MGLRLAPTLTFSALLLVACSEPQAPLREWRPEDHGEPSQFSGQTEAVAAAETNAPEDLGEAGGQARAAEALFNVSCASCHGRDGRGGGPGLPPGAQVPDFSSPQYQASRTNEALAQVIHDGRGMMPGFSKQVTPEGIAVLVAHVRSLAPTTAPQAAPQ